MSFKVAVITPYFKESAEVIKRNIDSVKNQSIKCDQYLIADGFPQSWIDLVDVKHIYLDRSHANFGNTPRCIGSLIAASKGYDAITFLDADNWFDSNHISECILTVNRNKNIDYIIAQRRFVRMNGSLLQFTESANNLFVDTNCIFLLPSSYFLLPLWGLTPTPLTLHCDRVFMAGLRVNNLKFGINDQVTVNYLCTWSYIYEELGEIVPDYAKSLDTSVLIKWLEQLTPEQHVIIKRRLGFSFRAELVNGQYVFTPSTEL